MKNAFFIYKLIKPLSIISHRL